MTLLAWSMATTAYFGFFFFVLANGTNLIPPLVFASLIPGLFFAPLATWLSLSDEDDPFTGRFLAKVRGHRWPY